jgi:citrate synthase
MPNSYISPISGDALSVLCDELNKDYKIKSSDFERFGVKRGLRNADGTGVMTGLTKSAAWTGTISKTGSASRETAA